MINSRKTTENKTSLLAIGRVLPSNLDTSVELLREVSELTYIVRATGNAFAAADFEMQVS